MTARKAKLRRGTWVLLLAGCGGGSTADDGPSGAGAGIAQGGAGASSAGAGSAGGAGGVASAGHGGDGSGASGAGVTAGGSGGATAGGAAGNTGVGCFEGAVEACYDGPNVTLGVGVCVAGQRTCTSSGTFGACEGQVVPSDEVCNALDDDCDGSMDEALTGGACDGADSDLCAEGALACSAGVASCSDATGDDVEICDWADNDCNGLVDEVESTAWATSLVDGTGNVGIASALRFDAADGIHLVYYDTPAKALKYVGRQAGGNWSAPVVIDSTGSTAAWASLAVETNGTLHVAYRDDSTLDLRYAVRPTGGTWTPEPVDSAGNTGDDPAIAVDRTGMVHITYRDNSNMSLRHASGSAGNWSKVNVDTSGNTGKASAIAIDLFDRVHVSYYNLTNADLMYVSRSAGPMGTWGAPASVDEEGDSGSRSSIAVGGCGDVHISYYRGGPAKDLRYARLPVGGVLWTGGELIELASDSYGIASSIGVEPLGTVYVAFVDSVTKRLMVSRRIEGSWTTGPLDLTAEIGGGVSLRTDSHGHVATTYFDAVNKDLRFASSCAGAAGIGSCVQRVSFELDPSASDIDIGWIGHAHNLPWVTDSTLTLCADSCDSASAPFGTCNLSGPIANIEKTNAQRCKGDSSKVCSGCADCGGLECLYYFGAPVPARVGGSAVCMMSNVEGSMSSQMNIEAGTASVDTMDLSVTVFFGEINRPCPVCEGDATANDRQRGGVCNGGIRDGQSCDAGGWSDPFGVWTSLDCPPDAGTVGTLPISMGPLTSEGVTWTLDAQSPSCTGEMDCKAFCPGTAHPDGCDNTCISDSNGDGACDGPMIGFCEGNAWDPFVQCAPPPQPDQCPDRGGGTCTKMEALSCFPDNGQLGGSIQAAGESATMGQGETTVRLGSVFCLPAFDSDGANAVVGLPGPGRISATMKVKVLGPSP